MTTNEKIRLALQCQTDRNENLFTISIPQGTAPEKLAIEMESTEKRDPIGIDSFLGSMSDFKRYLKARRIYLQTGVIVP